MTKELVKKLKYRENIFATTVGYVEWGGIIELFSDPPPDMIIFDIEHGVLSQKSIENHFRTCRLKEIPAIARTEDKQYNLISKMLDFGASGVLIPRVETVQQSKDAINAVRFPPLGEKGCGGYSLLKKVDGVNDFNNNKIIFLQIESTEGINNLNKMLDIGQFQGIIVGPTDLSIDIEIPFQYENPKLIAAIQQVMDICNNRGVSSGIYCNTPDDIKYWCHHGANIIWSGIEIEFIRQGYLKLINSI